MPIAAIMPKDTYVNPVPTNLVRQDRVPDHTPTGKIVGQEAFRTVAEQS